MRFKYIASIVIVELDLNEGIIIYDIIFESSVITFSSMKLGCVCFVNTFTRCGSRDKLLNRNRNIFFSSAARNFGGRTSAAVITNSAKQKLPNRAYLRGDNATKVATDTQVGTTAAPICYCYTLLSIY